MDESEIAIQKLAEWWDALPIYRRNNNLPARGAITGALVVLERLQDRYSLRIEDHLAKHSLQIIGLGRPVVTRILTRFGVRQSIPAEGGRTNLGNAFHVEALLQALAPLGLENLPHMQRRYVLGEMQRWVAGKISETFDKERLKFEFHHGESSCQAIADILSAARSRAKEGQVAQYLVGAKLALRFPRMAVRNDSYSTSDVQSGHPGDFLLGDVVYHVTVAPNTGHYTKCGDNVRDGYRVYLLVPDRMLLGTRQNLSNIGDSLARSVSTQSIESYVSQNLDEYTIDTAEGLVSGLRQLIEIYNIRVDAAESDKSLLIEIPHNLLTL